MSNMDRKVVVIKREKNRNTKTVILNESVDDICKNSYYCDTLKTFADLDNKFNGDVQVELGLVDSEEIKLENFNIKLKGMDKVVSYPTLEKYITDYAGYLIFKVYDANIRGLLNDFFESESAVEKNLIIKKIQNKVSELEMKSNKRK